jgi:hypothetical protein
MKTRLIDKGDVVTYVVVFDPGDEAFAASLTLRRLSISRPRR